MKERAYNMFTSNFSRQPQTQTQNMFANPQQTNMGMPRMNTYSQFNNQNNKSDSEFKAVLNTYGSLYNSKNSQCLFRLPVFNFKYIDQKKVDFQGDIPNYQELEFLYANAEQRLNPDHVNLNTCILIGMENLQKRVQIDKNMCEGLVKQLDQEVSKKIKEIDNQLEGVSRKKIKQIKENNASILKRVIGFEKKLFFIARKLKRVDLNLEVKINVMNVLKELSRQMVLIDKSISDLRYMIDGKKINSEKNIKSRVFLPALVIFLLIKEIPEKKAITQLKLKPEHQFPVTSSEEKNVPISKREQKSQALHKMMKHFKKKISHLKSSMSEMREDAEDLSKYFKYNY